LGLDKILSVDVRNLNTRGTIKKYIGHMVLIVVQKVDKTRLLP
jgi:hypothetical protein